MQGLTIRAVFNIQHSMTSCNSLNVISRVMRVAFHVFRATLQQGAVLSRIVVRYGLKISNISIGI